MANISETSAVILAGGMATRLGGITQAIPKALIDVAGKPFIDHQVRLLGDNGFRHIVFCIGHLGEQIQQHLGDGSSTGMKFDYSFDGPKLLGTGGAIRRAAHLLPEQFFILYGDSYMDINYPAVLRHFSDSKADGLMTIIRNDDQWDSSNAIFRDGELLRYDKKNKTPEMNFIDYGIAILRKSAIEEIATDASFDLAELYTRLVAEGRMIGYEVHERFYEIGTPQSLEEARRFLTEKEFSRTNRMSYVNDYIAEATQILAKLDVEKISRIVELAVAVRNRGGRIFFLGVGGSAANASHAVNDFRKIAGFEAYAPTDNVSELTARTNDDGWETVFVNWLRGSRLTNKDMLFIFSVGGGDLARNISPNLVRALQYAKQVGSTICGIVGRDGGYTAQVGDAVVIVPTINTQTITPHAEAFQGVIWHLIVTHPDIRVAEMKWESAAGK
jgi:D-sedoheptulose 7-phosphate isomerase